MYVCVCQLRDPFQLGREGAQTEPCHDPDASLRNRRPRARRGREREGGMHATAALSGERRGSRRAASPPAGFGWPSRTPSNTEPDPLPPSAEKQRTPEQSTSGQSAPRPSPPIVHHPNGSAHHAWCCHVEAQCEEATATSIHPSIHRAQCAVLCVRGLRPNPESQLGRPLSRRPHSRRARNPAMLTLGGTEDPDGNLRRRRPMPRGSKCRGRSLSAVRCLAPYAPRGHSVARAEEERGRRRCDVHM